MTTKPTESIHLPAWAQAFPGAVTICDLQGIIIDMNDRAAADYAKDGGRALIGQNLFDCHPEPSRSKLRQLMEDQQSNVYTIEKNGVKKLVYQSPWVQDGQYLGYLEMVLVIPFDMPHFIRK